VQPPPPHTDHPPSRVPGHWTLEAEQSITKEVPMHVVRDPDGRPISYHRHLSHAFDALAELAIESFVLVSAEWTVLCNLDSEAQLIPVPES
jgi:hypothetical protein